MDLARFHLEIDLVIGDDAGESLGDPLRLQDRIAAFVSLPGVLLHCLSSAVI